MLDAITIVPVMAAQAGAGAVMAPPPPVYVPVYAPPPAPPPPQGVPGFASPVRWPVPMGNPGQWVLPEDYPSRALRNGEQGLVGFAVIVDTGGRVERCEITQSSGSVDLDEATCHLVSMRARFNPALDAKGEPTPARYSSRVRWTIPRDSLPPNPRGLLLSYVVQPDGKVSDCKAEFTNLPPGFPASKVCETLHFDKGYTDAQGKPEARRVTVTHKIEVLPVDEKP